MLRRYAHWVTQRPLHAMLITLLLLIAASMGIGQLSFKSDLRIYFSKDNPQIAALDNMEQTYTKVDNVLFVLAPKQGVFTPEVLRLVADLTAQAWHIPYASRVDSITNFKYSSASGDDIVVDDLVVDVDQLHTADLEKIRAIATTDPLLVNRAISPNGQVTGINVTINIPKGEELSSVPKVVAQARALAAEIQAQHPDIDIYLSGVVMMDNAFAEASEADMKTLVPAMLVISLLIMGLIMRSWLAGTAALLVLTFAIVTAMGLAGWLGILLNPVSINAPNIILTVAICDCVHLLIAYMINLRTSATKQDAMITSLAENTWALFVTNITTCIGFLTLNFSEAPPFRDLGNITALGVIAAFVFTLLFLPAFMMFFNVQGHSSEKSRLQTAIDRLANIIIARPKQILLAMSVFVLSAGAGIFNNVLNDEFVKYFDEDVEFRQATDFTAEHLTGIYYIDYALKGATPSGINEPAYLHSLGDFTDWLRTQPEVIHVNSITDIYKRLNKNMHGDNPEYYRLPESSELAAQYLLMYEMSLPYGLDLRDRINASKEATRITATLKNLSSNDVLAFEQRVQTWLNANNQHLNASEGTGMTVMFANIGLRNIQSMLMGTFIAAAIISLLLIFIFRSLKYGLVSLLPNVLPAAMAFGIWGLLVGQIGLALSVMSAMTLGIVVDDTVHFLTKYLRARREKNMNAEDAIRYAFHKGGVAIVTTTLALSIGFGILGFSSFEINSSMGILTAIAIGLALILDLLLLPSLLLVIDRHKKVIISDEKKNDLPLTGHSSANTMPHEYL